VHISRDFTNQIRRAWHEFIDKTDSLRPELFRYCRGLTGTIWDAEDLVQETLVRTFVRFAEIHDPIENPRAYLFRVASNLWIDRFRRLRETGTALVLESEAPDVPLPRELRDAASHLVGALPPQERVAVLLKVALALETSVGAVKAALHRARQRLSQGKTFPCTSQLVQTEKSLSSFDLEAVSQLWMMRSLGTRAGRASKNWNQLHLISSPSSGTGPCWY
jgi:RNA polymerase sigma factor (sigma-70 family)